MKTFIVGNNYKQLGEPLLISTNPNMFLYLWKNVESYP